MKTSETVTKLAEAMHAAQAEMTAAIKDSSNPFFRSNYADLNSVIKAIKPAFSKHGLSYTQAPRMEDNCVGVTTRIMHTSGEWMESTLMLPMVKPDPQAAGSAISYARRYALQAIAGLPAADDDAEFAMARDTTKEDRAVADSLIELMSVDEPDLLAIGQIWEECDKHQMERLWVSKTKNGYFTQKEKETIRAAVRAYKEANA